MADFKLGRIKFKWRGDWAVDTAFLIDDVVKYGGNTYVCIQKHTSPSNENLFYTSPGTYTDYWSLQAESLFFKGAYADATWYKLNDLVSYGGKQYRVTTTPTSSSAVLNQANFKQYIDEYEEWEDINKVKEDTENPYKQFKAWEGVIIKGGSPVPFKFIHNFTNDGDVDLEVDEDVACLSEFLCEKLIWEK